MVPGNPTLRCSLLSLEAETLLQTSHVFICIVSNEIVDLLTTLSVSFMRHNSVKFSISQFTCSGPTNHESKLMYLTLQSITHMHSRAKSWRGRGSPGFAAHRGGLGGCVCQTGGR